MVQALNKLTADEKEILVNSLETLRRHSEFFVIRFYNYMLQTKARILFKHTDMEKQSKMFVTALNLIFDHLSNSSYLDNYMPKLVEKHTEYGNMNEYIDDFKYSFTNALQEVFSEKTDNQIIIAWIKVLEELLSYFIY